MFVYSNPFFRVHLHLRRTQTLIALADSLSVSLSRSQWLVRSKLLASLLVERLPGSSSPRRLQGNQPQPLVESRSPIVTALELLPFVKSESIRRAPNFLSASCLFNALFVKLLKTSRLT